MKELRICSNAKNEMIDITDDLQRQIITENLVDGFIIVYVPHTTAGITINEGADPSVQQDIIEQLKRIVPENSGYNHLEGNSDAHIKASLLGSSITIIVRNKKLILGTWQHIFFYEGDGSRNRKVYISFNYK